MIRVDVMSLKGGAGKTTLAFRLAWAQARARSKPVLLVDADFAGTCLGDLLEPWVTAAWGTVPNLVDLVCDRPETLPERLSEPARLPVYRLRPSKPASGPAAPAAVNGPVTGPAVLFCPSHVDSVAAHVEPPLLHALVAHESAGGWVQHVIEAVVTRAGGVVGDLGGVVVDHSPGMSALPWATLRSIGDHAREGRADWKALFVATPEMVDLNAWSDIGARRSGGEILDRLRACSVWAVNRVRPTAKGRPDTLRGRLPEKAPEGQWLDGAAEVPHDEELARAYAEGGLVQLVARQDPGIEGLRTRLFDEGTR